MVGDFIGIMDIHSDETLAFAAEIFTAHGNVRPELITNQVKKGSGVWGTELNKGSIVLIERIRVAHEHRKKGFGSWLLAQTLKIPQISANCNFAFAWPTVLNFDNDCPDSERETRIALIHTFFHRAGFRRVGRTRFLGYAMHDAAHPSRMLPIEQDPPLFIEKEPTQEELARDSPLHTAIFSKSDDALGGLINTYATNDPASIHAPDFAGNTPMHMAAVMGKVGAVRQLLALGGPQMLEVSNNEGRTPLQALQANMESLRNFFDAMVDRIPWPGFGKEQCSVLLELLQAAGKPVPSVQPDLEPWTALKWGCTCGKCIAGWLSSRMQLRIHRCAEVASDVISDTEFPARKIITKDELLMTYMSDYIPLAIRSAGIYPTYLKGYSVIFGAIARTFSKYYQATPFRQAIHVALLSISFHDTKYKEYYFSHGGTIEHALYGVVHRSWEESPLGDNSGEEIYGEELRELPECANDLAFDLVCNRLGLPPLQKHGFGTTYCESKDSDVETGDEEENSEDDEDESDDEANESGHEESESSPEDT